MAHLLNYEIAEDEATKNPTQHNFAKAALCALDCSDAKGAKARAWSWAKTAAEWAEKAGIVSAEDYLENMRWPETDPLRQLLTQLTKQPPVAQRSQ